MSERPEKKAEKPPEGADLQPQASSNLTNEGVRDDKQAPRYEPKFKSFSGHAVEHSLSPLHSSRDAETTTEAASGDWFASLMRRLGASQERKPGGAVAEFVLEDKEQNKEHTASGERYIARPSYLDGLKAQVSGAKTLEEAEQIQALFSVEYILKKARDFGFAAMATLTPKEQSNEVQFRERHHLANDAVIIASRIDVASDAMEPVMVKPRQVDAGLASMHDFPSPPDVLTVHRDGKAGKVINQWGQQSSLLGEEESFEDFVIETVAARHKLVLSHPAAPPLICLDIPESAVGTASRPAVASVLAYKTGDYVLGKAKNGDLILFGPGGDELPHKITNPESGAQWEEIRDISTAHFNYNVGWERIPDYREDAAFDAITRAPSDVVSIVFHGVPGKPENMTYEQALVVAKKTKSDCIANQAREHRKLHDPSIMEVLSCDSASGPNKHHGNNDEENSVAAKLAKDTGSWTIGYGSTVDGQTGKTRNSPAELGTKGEPAVLFDPRGHPIKEKFDTPLTVASWKKIRQYTEMPRVR